MSVRFRFVTAALVLFMGSAAARCDLKIVTLTHVDCSRLLIDGVAISPSQLADLQADSRFSAEGLISTIWIKGPEYRVDECGLTTVTNCQTDTVTVIDRLNKLYYIVPAGKLTDVAHITPTSTRLSTKSQPTSAFGYNAATVVAQMRWKTCALTCTALCTNELSALPASLPIAVPAVADLLPKLGGLPLSLSGTVNMPRFMGELDFDWHVTSLSTATFQNSEMGPPTDCRKIDPPNAATGMRIAVEAKVAVDPAIAMPR